MRKGAAPSEGSHGGARMERLSSESSADLGTALKYDLASTEPFPSSPLAGLKTADEATAPV